MDLNNEDFIIPELPSGIELTLDITSTWGDRHYVGLNGIEIFSVTGELVPVAQVILLVNLDVVEIKFF